MIRSVEKLSGVACEAAVAVVVICLAATPIAAQAPASGQFPPYKAPRLAGTATPDLNGIWQAITTANWDIQDHDAQPGLHPELEGAYDAQPPGQGIVVGGEIPYQPWALAKKKENFDKRLTADPFHLDTGDPEAKCYLPGVPRATYMNFPFQIIQSKTDVLIAYEYAGNGRAIHLGKLPPPPTDSWMGQSEGHFEGDTLVVTATGFNDRTWLDRAGDFHSDALKVTERYTPASPYHLMYEATIEDPKVFTRPWKIGFPLYRRMEKNIEILQFKCVEFVEEFLYGTLRKPGTR